MEGQIRSVFLMTEPAVASSDATNIETRIDLDAATGEYVINGRKWWSSGAMDPRCKVGVLMGKTDVNAPRHRQQSMVLVPMDAPGITLVRALSVFGYDDAPHGHAEVLFEDVRVPRENLLLGEGRGFEIAQGRLGPGRIHHCMRAIGVSEVAQDLMIKRCEQRTTFGKKLSQHGTIMRDIAWNRIEIDQARLLVLHAASLIDAHGDARHARKEVAMIKIAVPNMALRVIDRALQAHGGAGVCQDFPLAEMYAHMRTLRIADGPDEVHVRTVAKLEMRQGRRSKL
jgi:acyl-CoA dehydrogenase